MKLLNKIYVLLAAIFTSILLEGCVSENFKEEESLDPDKAVLVLHLRALDAIRGDENEVAELIKTLRIIMIDEESDQIEVNELIGEEDLYKSNNSDDLYYFFRITNPGIKKFYLFANEDNFTTVKKEDNSISDNRTVLSSLLKAYEAGGEGTAFEEMINTVYFSLSADIKNNQIYLPYSAYYILNMEAGKRYDKTMWLVPAATKFYFNFTNNRSYPVRVKEMSLSQGVSRNYVLGKVEESQQKLNIEEKELYWVDWLAEISRMSQEYPSFDSNVNFNDKYGWITDYSIPTTSNSYKNQSFIETGKEEEIPAKTDIGGGNLPEPGKKSFGPFYLPESRYIPKNEKSQKYNLLLQLEDTMPEAEERDQDVIELTNLHSLFRNTHVVVNINLNEGSEEIYVEIQSWHSTDNFYGTANKQ